MCRQTYRPERPKGAKDEVKRPLAAKPAASKADYSRPRQTIADYSRPRQTMADQSILIRGATSISDASIDISMNLLGKGSVEKSRFLSGIARISNPPIRATWSFFSGRQDNVLRAWQKKQRGRRVRSWRWGEGDNKLCGQDIIFDILVPPAF